MEAIIIWSGGASSNLDVDRLKGDRVMILDGEWVGVDLDGRMMVDVHRRRDMEMDLQPARDRVWRIDLDRVQKRDLQRMVFHPYRSVQVISRKINVELNEQRQYIRSCNQEFGGISDLVCHVLIDVGLRSQHKCMT